MILGGAFISLSKHFLLSLSLNVSLATLKPPIKICSSQIGTLLQQKIKCVDLQGSNGGSQHKLKDHTFAKTLSESQSKDLLLH